MCEGKGFTHETINEDGLIIVPRCEFCDGSGLVKETEHNK